jgi:hypothetical protein
MRSLMAIFAIAMVAGACAADPTMPTRPYQWEQRQERIEREFAARQALCVTIEDESDRRALDCPQRRSGAEE